MRLMHRSPLIWGFCIPLPALPRKCDRCRPTLLPLPSTPMRALLLLLACLPAFGCAEAVHGPRVVVYSPERFYIRHVPWRDGRSDVRLLADAVCDESPVGGLAVLESADQFTWLDIRYATFRCVPVAEPSDPAPPSEPFAPA
jgi:hypothetical protein